jgi:hypothetical protein
MSAPSTFTAKLLGQTEKAANALLQRILAGHDLTEPQWVTLSVAMTNEGPVTNDELVGQVSSAAKFSRADVEADVSSLSSRGLLAVEGPGGLSVSERGRATFSDVRTSTTGLAERLWGDVDPADLATSARVLSAILAHADEELAAATV